MPGKSASWSWGSHANPLSRTIQWSSHISILQQEQLVLHSEQTQVIFIYRFFLTKYFSMTTLLQLLAHRCTLSLCYIWIKKRSRPSAIWTLSCWLQWTSRLWREVINKQRQVLAHQPGLRQQRKGANYSQAVNVWWENKKMARCTFTWVAGPVKFDSVLGLGRLWFEYCTLEDGPVMEQLWLLSCFLCIVSS